MKNVKLLLTYFKFKYFILTGNVIILICSFLTKSFQTSAILNTKRLSNLERSKFNLDDFLKQVLVGGLLGDVYMRRFSIKSNAPHRTAGRGVVFRQGSTNAQYLYHLYDLFKMFVLTPPSISTITDKNTGKKRYNLSFATMTLPCFNDLYESFYLEGKKSTAGYI